MSEKPIRAGLDAVQNKWPKNLKGARAGLLVHPASVDSKFEHAVDLFGKSGKFQLKALFGPQHGIRASARYSRRNPGQHDRMGRLC